MKRPTYLFLFPIVFLGSCTNMILEADRIVEQARQANSQTDSVSPVPREHTVVRKDESRGTTSEVHYVDGAKNGLAREYYSNGKLWKESPYKDDRLHGVAKIYDRQGRLQRTVTYHRGQKHGKYTRYFKSGNPKIEIDYEQNLPMPGYVHRDYLGEEISEPEIVITEVDRLAEQSEYRIEVSLSKPHKNLQVYVFQDTGMWKRSTPLELYKVPMEDGIAYLPLEVEPRHMYEGELYFFALYELDRGVEVVKQKKLQLSVRN